MEFAVPVALALSVLALALSVLALAFVMRNRTMRDARLVAEGRGLAFEPGIIGYRMHGTVREVPIQVWTTAGDSGREGGVSVRVVLSGDLPRGLIFQSRFGAPSDPQLQIGIPALDEGHLVRGQDFPSALEFVRRGPVAETLVGLVAAYPNVFIRDGVMEARLRRSASGQLLDMVDDLVDAAVTLRESR